MNITIWAKRLLHAVFLLGTAAAVALWFAALTAKCEGFGCVGVGAMVWMAFMVQLVCVLVGAILIWWRQPESRPPGWLMALEAVHALPVLWFGGRMALS